MIQAISETITGSVNLIVKVVCLDWGGGISNLGEISRPLQDLKKHA